MIKEHIESFYDLLYAKDARVWRFNLSPAGATRIFIEADARAPRVSFANESDEIWTFYRQQFDKNGFEGPLNYYKVASSEIDSEDAKSEHYPSVQSMLSPADAPAQRSLWRTTKSRSPSFLGMTVSRMHWGRHTSKRHRPAVSVPTRQLLTSALPTGFRRKRPRR